MKDGQKLSLRSKVSVSVCFLILLSIFVYSAQIPAAHSWGWDTHRFIETKAELVFSNNSFFSNNHNTLYFWCIQPDNGWGNSDWHYLDAENYNPLQYTGGKLPWAMENIFENLVQKLQNKNWSASENLMGAICHFTADSTMPLHSTYDYNPGGHHGDYETTVNNNLGQISIPDNYVPQKLDNITAAALASLAKSFTYTKEGANRGDNNLTDFLLNNILWNSWIRSMTENRVRAAVQFTANVWYSAMIQAGLTIQAPTLTSPSDGSSTSDNTPTFTWTSVSGTSSYDFQLASDNNFTINAVTVKGLVTNSYTPVNPLTNGGWYWHVRTGDNSADVGLWSQTRSFTISVSTQNPVVVISPISQSGANGATLTYTVTVSNTENASDNFNLTASDNASPSWGPTVSPTSLTIPAGENRTSTLSVTILSSAIGGTINNVTVTATGIGVSGSGSCTAQATIARGVQVVITPPSQENDNGGTLKYDVLVKNLGNVLENFQLTKGDNAGWTLTLDNNWLSVPKGENRMTNLTVNIPTNAIGGTLDNVWLKAASKDNAVAFDNESCLAQVTIFMGVDVTISPNYQENLPGGELDYTVMVSNIGKIADIYSLENIDNMNWILTLDDGSLTVPAGENRTTTLHVTIPGSAENDTRDNITVIATSQENSQVGDNASCIAHAGVTTEEFTLQLIAGWNFVGFPLENENTTPINMFGSNLMAMKYWTAPSGPYKDANYSAQVQDNIGYWVELKNDQDVILSGMPPTSRTLYLVAGWNLVHFPLTSASTTPINLFGSNLKTMKYWTAPSGPYKDANYYSEPVQDNLGYWIQLNNDEDVTVPL
jgi:hypothetical protein